MLRPLGLILPGLLLAGSVLSGCSDDGGAGGGSSSDGDSRSTATATASTQVASPSAYPSAPEAVSLTEPGTELALGESATVAWQPVQSLVGVLDVSVTAVERTTFEAFRGWQVDDAVRQQTPYFVRARVANAGETDLATQPVPLYAVDGSGALVEPSTFGGEFEPCRPQALPTPFAPGAGAEVCLVYLLPPGGTLAGVSFRPADDFEPITWSGTVTDYRAPGRAGSPAATPTASPSGSPTS